MECCRILMFVLSASFLVSRSTFANRIDYYGTACDNFTFKFICPQGHGIWLKSAFYGRNDPEFCLDGVDEKDLLDLNCSADGVTEIIRDRCNDKQTCDVDVGISEFGDPCPGTRKYLKVEFDCVEPTYRRVQCEGDSLNLQCPSGTFISPEMTVMYGRHDNVTCYNDDALMSTNCTSEVAENVIRDLCQTKQNCQLHISYPLLGDPCPDNYKYIEVNYTCSVCVNEHSNSTECDIWTSWGECQLNPKWMMAFCRQSCTGCGWRTACKNIYDDDGKCEYWASTGECAINPDYMHYYCKRSCNRCGKDEGEESKPDSSLSVSVTAPPTTTVPYVPVNQVVSMTVCEGDRQRFGCPPRSYLRIHNATFGRTTNDTCSDRNQGDVNDVECHSLPDVFTKVHNTCTGRISCVGSAYNDALGDPCPGTFKYLEVHFSCQECKNEYNDALCNNMTVNGECISNVNWMYENCFKSCSGCHYSSCGNMLGEDDDCDYWSMREECVLNPQWMTENCRESCRKCKAEVPTCEPDCGLHGICVATNTCICDIGYFGSDCTLYDCTGVNNCSDHGTCIGPDQCQCDGDWIGAECSDFSCEGVSQCNKHGHCVGRDKCLCYPYWSGDTCSVCLLENDSGSSCLPCPACVHGTCRHGEQVIAYKGCYSDDANDPDFPFAVWQDTGTTTAACMRWCLRYKYTYAATTEGNSCRCGNRYGTHGLSTSCDIECSAGEGEEICGGRGAYSVWQTHEGSCQCNGPNWAGPLCDRCAPGYKGDDCLPANRTMTTTTTTTTTTTSLQSSHFVPSSTRTSTTESSKSATSDSPNMITDRNPQPATGRRPKTSPASISTTVGDVLTSTSTVRIIPDYDVLMTLVLKMPWRDIYNDTTRNETRHLMAWISDRLTEYYSKIGKIKVDEVIIKRLRPGSVRVVHVIRTTHASTFVEKKAIQCAIAERLFRDRGFINANLTAQPEPELVNNCAIKGVYCLNGATPGFDDNGFWICQCPYKHTGRRCQNTVNDKTITIVIIIISVFVPLAILLILSFAIPKYRRKVKGGARRLGIDDNTVTTNVTATSFEFHSMPGDLSRNRTDDDRKLYTDTSSLGELNEAFTG